MTTSSGYIFDILRLIGSERRALGATDVSRRLGLTLTTAHRGLNTLERAGYIARYQSSTKYVLGDTSRALLHSFFTRFPLRDVALPYMQRLGVLSGETTSLFVPVGWYVARIASVKGTNEVIHTGPTGETFELDRNAAGRAVLAMLPEDRRRHFLSRQGVRPAGGGGDDLDRIRAQGYAIGIGEADHDHLAMPILGGQEAPLGALAIEGNIAVTSEDRQERLRDYLQVVHELSQRVQTGSRRIGNLYGHLDPDTISLPFAR